MKTDVSMDPRDKTKIVLLKVSDNNFKTFNFISFHSSCKQISPKLKKYLFTLPPSPGPASGPVGQSPLLQ